MSNVEPGIVIHIYLIKPRGESRRGFFRFDYWAGREHKRGFGINFYLFGVSFALDERGGE